MLSRTNNPIQKNQRHARGKTELSECPIGITSANLARNRSLKAMRQFKEVRVFKLWFVHGAVRAVPVSGSGGSSLERFFFFLLLCCLTARDSSSSGCGSWQTVPIVPIRLSVSGNLARGDHPYLCNIIARFADNWFPQKPDMQFCWAMLKTQKITDFGNLFGSGADQPKICNISDNNSPTYSSVYITVCKLGAL